MGWELDRALELTPTGPSEYAATLDAGWVIVHGVHGGYLIALLAHAARTALPGKPDPVAVSAHYVSASKPGPAELSVRVLRDGRSVGSVAVELSQGGELRISGLVTLGDLDNHEAEFRTTAPPLELPPLDECVRMPEEVRAMLGLFQRFDMAFDPTTSGVMTGQPSGNPEVRAWFRLADGREPDALAVLVALDALPPVTLELGLTGWVPTLELTCYLRATPAPGWLQIGHRARTFSAGMFEEDCEVWDSAGRLVGQARQLARLPRS